MSRVARMSIMNFLMVSNSCGLTLRELSMRKTRSTGPDLHFCSGPGGRNKKHSAGKCGAKNCDYLTEERPEGGQDNNTIINQEHSEEVWLVDVQLFVHEHLFKLNAVL